jgi:hypothetical protein
MLSGSKTDFAQHGFKVIGTYLQILCILFQRLGTTESMWTHEEKSK